MKIKALTIFILFTAINCYSQYSAKVTKGNSLANLNIEISEDMLSEDLGVEIGYNVFLEDIKIGFTRIRSQADVIITDNNITDFKVNIAKRFPDLKIEVSDDVFSEDIKIKLIKSGFADYLVYNELDLLSVEALVCALLPIINFRLPAEERLEKIPIYKSPNGEY